MNIRYKVYSAAGEYMGMTPNMERAKEAAKRRARMDGTYADVVRVSEAEKSGRRCRYYADGTVRQLWKERGGYTAKLEPHTPGSGGVIAMPMRKNIPHGLPGWELVRCPVCGRECWERPAQVKVMQEEPNLRAACTECALNGDRALEHCGRGEE